MQRKSLFAQPYRRDIAALQEPMPMRSGIRNDALRQSGPNRCDNEHFGFSNYRKNATLRKRKDHAPFERDEYVHNKSHVLSGIIEFVRKIHSHFLVCFIIQNKGFSATIDSAFHKSVNIQNQ